MSYILDALRRAEAERRRGEPPALDQVARWPALDAAPGRPRERRPGWLLALGVIAACAAAAAAAWWWSRAMPAPSTSTPSPVATAPMTASPVAPPPMAGTALGVTAPPRLPPPLPAHPPPPRATAPRAPAASASAPPARPASAPAAASAAPPAAASAPEPPPVNAATLPEPQRSTLARLGLAGGVYSPERSQRFVLVGGQIAHEGEALAPGIVLERIQPRSALLRVEGRLVEMPL